MDCCHNDFICIVSALQATYQRCCVGVLLHAAFLELIELVTSLLIEVFAINDKDAFLDVGVELQKSGSLEAGECLTAAGGVPDETVSAIFCYRVNDALYRIYLIWAHHKNLPFCLDQHQISAQETA